MRKSIDVSPNIETFFGTRDENLHVLEDGLNVNIDLRSEAVELEGTPRDIARPAVEAGERLGFLPGTLQEKIDPYLRPLYDALYDMLDPERVDRYLEKSVIEIAPIAFMRGRTLNDSFVILDEAQNTTSEQMKMFVTRLGFNSKAVITGDVTQIDLPNARRSGMLEAVDILKNVQGLSFVYFDESDVVRHHLVQRIIRAYDEHKTKVAEEQMELLDAKAPATWNVLTDDPRD